MSVTTKKAKENAKNIYNVYMNCRYEMFRGSCGMQDHISVNYCKKHGATPNKGISHHSSSPYECALVARYPRHSTGAKCDCTFFTFKTSFMLLCNVKKNNSNERSYFLTKSWRLSMNHRFIFGDRKNTLNPVLGITQSSMSERGKLNASSL